MQGNCRVCSKLSFRLKAIFFRLLGKEPECQKTFERIETEGNNRVAKLFSAIPHCACECCRVSKHSPNVITGDELIARHVISPVHVMPDGKFKPSLFSHVFNKGCSVQREDHAEDPIVAHVVTQLAEAARDGGWFGMVFASAKDIRNICISSTCDRAVCLYDTAEPNNAAHAEIFLSRPIVDADDNEIRAALHKCFGDGVYQKPEGYRDGRIWGLIDQPVRDRTASARTAMGKKLARQKAEAAKKQANEAKRATQKGKKGIS
jgi:hypothetical protein